MTATVGARTFFSVDDDGQFRLTTLTAFEFRGQPRISATAGPCESVDAASKIASAPDPEERCKSGDVQACITAPRPSSDGTARGAPSVPAGLRSGRK